MVFLKFEYLAVLSRDSAGGGRLGLRHFFVTDGQKRDYLSRASQRARGATKKMKSPMKSADEHDPRRAGQWAWPATRCRCKLNGWLLERHKCSSRLTAHGKYTVKISTFFCHTTRRSVCHFAIPLRQAGCVRKMQNA